MKRIILHWDAGNYEPDRLTAEHYHFAYDATGVEHAGKHAPEANLSTRDGVYAAHTRHANTGSIGLAALGMHQAKQNGAAGPYPITDVSIEAMCKGAARLAAKYGIAVDRATVLTHAEVEGTLGIKQRGKIDIMWLPGRGWMSAREAGDYLRGRVRFHLSGAKTDPRPALVAFDGPHTSAFRAFAPPAMQKLMEALEIDKLDAAAMLGNFGRETGGLKYMEELTPANPPGGINLAQWTGVRRKAFEDWCEASGRDPRSWDAGLDYAIFEMTETWEKRVIPAMRAEKTLWSKTKVFEDLYERAGVPALSDRVRWAMTALEAYDAAPEGSLALPKPAAPKSTGKATGGAIATGGGSMALIDGLMSGSWPLIIGGGVIGLIGIGVFLASSRSKEA